MYYVIINDHKSGLQKMLAKTVYINSAIDICEETAIDIVLNKKGNNCINEITKNMNLRKKRNILPEGYSVIKSKSKFPKYTVLYKEPNGYISYGNFTKICTIFAVKIPGSILPKAPEQSVNVDIDIESYDCFSLCLDELKEKFSNIPEIEEN